MPSASRVPPKSNSTTAASRPASASVMPRSVPHVHLHHHGAAAEPHRVPQVALIQGIAHVGRGPLRTAVWDEETADDAHAAVRDQPAGRIVVEHRHAIAMGRLDVDAEPGPAVQALDRDPDDLPRRVRLPGGAIDDLPRRRVAELDALRVRMDVAPDADDGTGDGWRALVGARRAPGREVERLVPHGKRAVQLERLRAEERPGATRGSVLEHAAHAGLEVARVGQVLEHGADQHAFPLYYGEPEQEPRDTHGTRLMPRGDHAPRDRQEQLA